MTACQWLELRKVWMWWSGKNGQFTDIFFFYFNFQKSDHQFLNCVEFSTRWMCLQTCTLAAQIETRFFVLILSSANVQWLQRRIKTTRGTNKEVVSYIFFKIMIVLWFQWISRNWGLMHFKPYSIVNKSGKFSKLLYDI